MRTTDLRRLLFLHGRSLLPAAVPLTLMIVWAIHNGGYDADTWYWGALLALATLAPVVAVGARASTVGRVAALLLAAYVAWSYASITWASSQGDALQGSNRALLYLIVFALMAMLPWTAEAALLALLTVTVSIGVIALVILVRFASGSDLATVVLDHRLVATTGYFNTSAGLFTIGACMAIGLAARRELPGLLRGALIAFAGADLQVAITAQSRGWLFTLPLVAVLVAIVLTERLRAAAAAILPVVVALIPLHRLLGIYRAPSFGREVRAGERAGRMALPLFAGTLFVGTLAAWGDLLAGRRRLSRRRRLQIGTALVAIALGFGCAGAAVATHGHPLRFIDRQWRGFSHPRSAYVSNFASHFAAVGTGRYDIWRVSLEAFRAHPIGGLGQDNFAEYFVVHRRTNEEPAWTHSFELRLLAHTGVVGFLLFAVFLAVAIAGAVRARRRAEPELARAAAGVALVPLIVWLVQGSVDWFWEMPALSGPAFGFLGMATALVPRGEERSRGPARRPRAGLALAATAGRVMVGLAALLAAAAVLGFSYASVREVSSASDVAASDPAKALRDLATAAKLNPLSADPSRLAGTIALRTRRYGEAEQRFRQTISRDPDGWYGWLGAGLAASARGHRAQAHRFFAVAARINRLHPAPTAALARVYSRHPLTPAQAFQLLFSFER